MATQEETAALQANAAARANQIEAAGNEKFGETFREGVAALAAYGVNQEQLLRAMAQPDAVDRVHAMGRDAMIHLADEDDAANRKLVERRDKEREAYRKLKGKTR